ncbi:hypothetical protein PHJA_000608200 [Phtheirospermum japonicum]|uniref:Uncharacterized protein n=1 Tax=Phtheirospermum japonicum TaxID=374723 RepID=A0A830BKL9_9LAMI|nr:hypothetical protein PHJA_000608200 [Phtheirospermum japonicum]
MATSYLVTISALQFACTDDIPTNVAATERTLSAINGGIEAVTKKILMDESGEWRIFVMLAEKKKLRGLIEEAELKKRKS